MNRKLREDRIRGRREFSGRLLTLEVDEVRLPDGETAVREVIRHPGAAVILPLLHDGRVAMVRQFRYAIHDDLLELPAGKLDPGEGPDQAARRELVEEVGLVALDLTPLGSFFPAPGFSDEVIHAYVATEFEIVEATPDADEYLVVEYLSLSEVGTLMGEGRIKDAKTLATFALAMGRGFLPALTG